MKRRNAVLAILLLVVAVAYFAFHQTGYAFTEKEALRSAGVYNGLTKAYEQPFGSDVIVMMSNGSQSRVQIVHNKFGFLHKPGTSVEMAALDGQSSVRYAWFSTGASGKDGKREIVFAAESSDAAIRKVIISNDRLNAPKDSAEVKKNASVYVELDVAKQYGIVVEELEAQEIGSFVVRGADADGRIVTGT
ncbi:hypothetical protein GZH47_20755 [Paenibacillus rhizovicinus]|uniref:Uncharacterized protein n=1 Tax=Paenibacillus rhizovicinus TaxID=2704463 RepID=A0A6C0P370_9BACL|nr:hypothetical protein [Paenibacillus rhizovicinus]QHW32984.1 hypothetical protein GZH47_20755 [Paenibacillus rhizovicinus]